MIRLTFFRLDILGLGSLSLLERSTEIKGTFGNDDTVEAIVFTFRSETA
ncbi:MAG: hypothetical protein LBE67_10315 [Kocuria palustris]|nr:hypothetical protein [Kocuria palustris]